LTTINAELILEDILLHIQVIQKEAIGRGGKGRGERGEREQR